MEDNFRKKKPKKVNIDHKNVIATKANVDNEEKGFDGFFDIPLSTITPKEHKEISSFGRHNHKEYKESFKDPIPSFGLNPFYRDPHTTNADDVLFLIQQRRDTFEYVEFVQGLWQCIGSLEELFEIMCALFTLMSENERERIRNYLFSELWDDLYIDKSTKMYKDGYARAKKKYDMICDMIPKILDCTKSKVLEPPWGFPKGRKNNLFEKDIVCASRETFEETKIDINNCIIYQNHKFPERFQGSNGTFYSTLYFLCEVKEKPIIPEPIQTPLCIRKTSFTEEVSCIAWVSYKEACEKLNKRHQLILREVFRTVCDIHGLV